MAPYATSTLRLRAQLRNNTLPLVTDVGRFNDVVTGGKKDACDLEDIENGLQFVLLYIILRFKVNLTCKAVVIVRGNWNHV